MSSGATVRVKYEQSDIYEQFVDNNDVFETYIDFFVFAASVGYANNEWEDPGGDSEILWMHFTDKTLYKSVAAAIAYNHHNDPDALINPEVQLETLAKFAAGGTTILQEEFGDISGDPTDALLNYIQEYEDREDTESRQTVLENIMNSFDGDVYGSKDNSESKVNN